MKLLGKDFENVDIEWTEATFGYLSIPVFVIGILLFSFPDIVYKAFLEAQYRWMKPNRNFEDHIPNKEIPVTTERILKSIGMIMIVMGIIWFWFAKEFYELMF